MVDPSHAIECRQLFKTYKSKPPVQAVRGLDLTVSLGECFGLLGPNGAGKTTTIEILEGLLTPDAGEVKVLGMTWQKQAMDIRERIGISLQETKLSEKLTVLETVTLFRSFYQSGIKPQAALEQVELTEKAKSLTGKLSGGQKQRLAVACALVGNPDLLFLDEPTTGLDPQSRRQLWEIIRTLRQKGRTVLLTTHYMDEAERLCDRIVIVDHGKVIAEGTPRALIASIGGEHIIEITLDSPISPPHQDRMLKLPSVQSIRTDDGHIALTVHAPHVAIPALLHFLNEHQLQLTNLVTRHTSLEDVFVTLTGRHLRDEGNPSA